MVRMGTSVSVAGGGKAYGQRSRNITQSVGTSSLLICVADPSRQLLILTNDSANIIYIHFGDTAVANAGVRLNANGGSLVMGEDDMWHGSITAIASAASSNLCGVEVSRDPYSRVVAR
jgi:hypothetical protein